MNLGELWVAYEVELIHEKLNVDPDMNYARFAVTNPVSGFANLHTAAVLAAGSQDV